MKNYRPNMVKFHLACLFLCVVIFFCKIEKATGINIEEQESVYSTVEDIVDSFNKIDSVDIFAESWIQSPEYRETLKFKNLIREKDNYKLEGQLSFSKINPSGRSFSSSNWVQQYYIRGISFIWRDTTKQWEKGGILNDNDSGKKLKYRFLKNLFLINFEAIDPESFNFRGYSKKGDTDSFTISYKIDSEIIKKWYSYGYIEGKICVDKNTLLPIDLRLSGKLEGLDFLQIVQYKNYNKGEKFSIPEDIAKNLKLKERYFEDIFEKLIEYVSRVRGWDADALSEVSVEFENRKKIKEVIAKNLEKKYNLKKIQYEGEIFKWLNIIPKDAEYKDLISNAEFLLKSSFYDAEKKKIFIGDWLEEEIAENVCLREVVRAFQHKRIDLNSIFNGENVTYDQNTTRNALIEGESYAVALEYILNKKGDSFQTKRQSLDLIEKTVQKNSYLRIPLFYEMYVYGTDFVRNFIHRYEWTKLDELYKNFPVSMKEIIHPEYYIVKYEIGKKNEIDQNFIQPDFSSSFTNWEKVYLTSLGEYPIYLFFNKYFNKNVSIKAVSGWSDDNIAVYQNKNGENIFVYIIKWDKKKYAVNFYEKYKEWLKKKYSFFEKKGEGKFIPLEYVVDDVKETKSENKNKQQEEDMKAVIFYSPENEEKTVFKVAKDFVILIGAKNVEDEEFYSFIREMMRKTNL